MRALPALIAATVLTVLPLAAAAQEATTTRIETRPFYGATVTLEAGVRVYRPLPPHSKVIINPGGKTPVSLGFEENRFVSHNYNYNYTSERAAEGSDTGGDYVAGFATDGRGRHHHPSRRGGFGAHHGHGGGKR
jgi:hypothetical protein